MNIFLDFDDTIFNTRGFEKTSKKPLLLCGVSEEVFQASYREVKQSQKVNKNNDL